MSLRSLIFRFMVLSVPVTVGAAVSLGQPVVTAASVLNRMEAAAVPADGTLEMPLAGTMRLPASSGKAKLRAQRGVTEIDLEITGMQPAILFGGDFNTYVLWVLSPNGLITNVGEIVPQGAKGKLKATTTLSAFGLLVTAEPHFMVSKPSEFVVLKNSSGGLARQPGVAVYPLDYDDFVESYTYEREQLAGLEQVKGEQRSDRYQAIVATKLAEQSLAQEYAKEEFEAARNALSSVQKAFGEGIEPTALISMSRRAVQLAAEAERLAIERKAARDLAQERKVAQETIETLSAGKAAAESQAARYSDEAARATATLTQTQQKLRTVEQQMLRANQEADQLARQKVQAEQKAQSAQEQAEAFFVRLYNALDKIANIRETERGLTVSLPDILFDSGKYRLRPIAKEILSQIAGVLLVAPEYHLSIEGHTDSTGGSKLNLRLSQQRAQAVRDYLDNEVGISASLMSAAGFGETRPVASNQSAKGRQQNRRVEIIIEGLTRQ